MQDGQQDRLMAQGLREGKTEAWQALYDAYAERVWRGVARMLGPDRAEVADVVQETMIAAARSASSFDPQRGSLWQWLWGIAHNHAALYLRRQERYQRLIQSAAALAARHQQVLSWLEGKEPAPLAALASAELATLVRAALAELSADHAAILTARYLDGDAVSLMAQREECSESAVRSRLARARQAFRNAFSRFVQDSPDPSPEAHHETA